MEKEGKGDGRREVCSLRPLGRDQTGWGIKSGSSVSIRDHGLLVCSHRIV